MEIRHVSLVIIHDNGKFLLQKKDMNAPYSAGYWCFFGGGVEDGETPEDAIKRELLEELEYEIKNPKVLFSKKYNRDSFDKETFYFLEEYDGQKLVLHEGEMFDWFTIEEIDNLKIKDHNKLILKEIYNILKQSKRI